MDLFHRKPAGEDTRNGRECQFCYVMDSEFSRRKPLDRLVYSKMDDVAGAHMTEEGYLRHRIAELRKKTATQPAGENLLKTA